MGALKFYTDEHIDNAVTRGLRRRGIDAISAGEAGMLGRSDIEHLDLATAQERIVITKDRDFIVLHEQAIHHAGIISVPQHLSIGSIIRGVTFLCDYLDADDMIQRLEFLHRHVE